MPAQANLTPVIFFQTGDRFYIVQRPDWPVFYLIAHYLPAPMKARVAGSRTGRQIVAVRQSIITPAQTPAAGSDIGV